MLGWGSNDFSFKLNYQSIGLQIRKQPASRLWTRCVVESLYKLTPAHIGGNISLYVSSALHVQRPAGHEKAP